MTREEAIKVLGQMKDGFVAVHNGNPVMCGFSDYGVQAFDIAIEALSVDLVRCWECKYWNEEWEFCQISELYPTVTRADYYCGSGERRGNETD